jgi:hypothetical protein
VAHESDVHNSSVVCATLAYSLAISSVEVWTGYFYVAYERKLILKWLVERQTIDVKKKETLPSYSPAIGSVEVWLSYLYVAYERQLTEIFL